MKRLNYLLIIFMCLSFMPRAYAETSKIKFLIVDSYHKEYTWSQDTNKGFCEAMLKLGYFDSKDQINEFNKNDHVETSKAVIKKLWMNAKKESEKSQKEENSLKIYKIAKDFKPNLMFLGDDDAANFVGNKFLDTEVPIVLWGINNTPLKYGLIDSVDKPGHNVTGIYQSGYYLESFQLLKNIVPAVKTFAILSDEVTTSRGHCKEIDYLDRNGMLPLKLFKTIFTSDFEEFKKQALELQKKVDAFFITGYSGFKDKKGNPVPDIEAAKWYLINIKIPETSRGHRVKQGMLCAADDSGYSQGYEAVVIANDILTKGANPAAYPPRVPKMGLLIANKQRAQMLGITLTKDMGIEEIIEEAEALKKDAGGEELKKETK